MTFYRFLFIVTALLMMQGAQCETDTESEANIKQSTRVNASNSELERENKKCIENRCTEKSANGKCDEECNKYACNFDGFECSLGINPWKNCSAPFDCSNAFMDGNCDEACNNAQCLFDGRDCEKKIAPCPPIFEVYCRKHYANGICDYGCNKAECDWDGFDCDWAEPDIVDGTFSLVVRMDEQNFRRNVVSFQRDIGLQLWTSVRVKKGEMGKDMILPWEGESNNRTNPTAVIVHFEIDNRKCNAVQGTACFVTVGEAAAYLAAVTTKKSLSENFPVGK